jgi:predicted nuclease of restriction endonuclease-like (RecB) superfamily
MKEPFAFRNFVELCRRTHEEMRGCAVRAVDGYLVVRNWFFGWYIVEYEQNGSDRAEYGAATLGKLSAALKKSIGRGFSVDSLEQMRRFYMTYKNLFPKMNMPETVSRILGSEISETASRISKSLTTASPASSNSWSVEIIHQIRLSWSHYVVLLTIDNSDERRFYEIEAAENNWSVRELERQVASSLYERLALSRDKEEVRRLSEEGHVVEKAADLIKNPFVLEFLGLAERPVYSENELESAIIDRLETFLLELGKGFLFEARQKCFSFDNDHFYVDLVFYNRLLRCYVLIDLKRDKLTHQDLGQMQMYVNYFDRHVKLESELPTVGIVLCRRKNDALVELTLSKDANIFASKYQLYLPSKQELKAQVETVQSEMEKGGVKPMAKSRK